MMNSGSIRFRLTLWYAGVLAGILVLFSVAVYAGLNHFLRRNLHESVAKDAQEVGSIVRENANEADPNAIGREVGEHFSPESNDRAIRVLGPNGGQIYSSGASQAFPVWIGPPRDDQPSDMIYRPAGGPDVLIRTQAVQADSGKKYFIQVAASLAPTNDILTELLGVL